MARPVTALILCGGRGSRMGGVDKPLERFQGRPLVQQVLDRIGPQVQGRVLISANRHLDDYARLGCPVLPDSLSDFQGPLAGLLAGLAYVNDPLHRPTAPQTHPSLPAGGDHWLLCVSGDSPWLPLDLVDRLWAVMARACSATHTQPNADGQGARPDLSAQGDTAVHHKKAPTDSAMALGREAPDERLRSQPLASLIHTRHQQSLADALARGERRVEAWLRSLPLAEVPFDRPEDAFAFANINDRSQLERLPPAS
ncbi:molybdenum cofactor guanylyltransferase [Roseateles sp. SL47]|uniref:molybdenum cofactor guanylyltransferase n=1 Tax=Roseateles sp. SL47 TaxID=2995138 RepID=UPI0022701826|nr:molybdenum cofactor guanylyltransferase [Roseateles sp. SL47]WAC75624.1 molybdenum cofactor guanylyltransferase [Roseateles sp. SL47]